MGGAGLPADVRRFIERYLGSALELEILLLLHRQATVMTAAEIASALRCDVDHVTATLTRFTASGLVTPAGQGVAIRPGKRHRTTIDALGHSYETYRVAVVQAIFGGAT